MSASLQQAEWREGGGEGGGGLSINLDVKQWVSGWRGKQAHFAAQITGHVVNAQEWE